MPETNNPPTDDPSSSGAPAPATTEDDGQGKGSPAKPVEKQEEAYRKKQSAADKAVAERDEMADRIDTLESLAFDGIREKAINDFIKENAEAYPDVEAADLLRFATSPDDLEDTAKFLQDKHEAIRQKALADVREVPEDSMTEEEKEKALNKLKTSNDPNRFQKFLRLQSMKTRK